jgi:hypothetical protein
MKNNAHLSHNMKSLCFFVSYVPRKNKWLPWKKDQFHEMDIPYIEELKNHFDEVIVLTNVKPKNDKFNYLILPNKGYDFGFFYNAINNTDLSKYNLLALVNNSNVLLPNNNLKHFFSWCNENDSNFCGITDSFEISYHIQSHFLIFKNEAINMLIEFLEGLDFEYIFSIKDKNKLRKFIIQNIEIDLSTFMISKGLKPSSWFNASDMTSKYNKPIKTNLHSILWEELIKEGYPLMKKKIVIGEWDDFLPNPGNKHIYLRDNEL